MKILIADDNALIRKNVIRLLKDHCEGLSFIEAGNSGEIIESVKNGDIDFLIMDVNLPGMSGLEVLKRIKSKHSHLPVIIFSMLPSEHYQKFAIKSGAMDYIEKSNEEDLLEKVKYFIEGNKAIKGEEGVIQNTTY